MIIHDKWSLDFYREDLAKITYIKVTSGSHECNHFVTSSPEDGRFRQSLQRAKARVHELAVCNEWQYFCTFTLDSSLRDRYDLAAFAQSFTQLIANLNRTREDKIRYLLVPEQHKDGAWHMHGLLNGLHEGKDLLPNEYGYLDWAAYSSRFGYFSASPVKNAKKCASYVSKYVTKAFEARGLPKGGHMYYASRGLTSKTRIVSMADPADCPISWTVEEKKALNAFENDYVITAWIDPRDFF